MAAAFTLARMNHTNELTAMLASGVSLTRVIVPMVISAMLMGGRLSWTASWSSRRTPSSCSAAASEARNSASSPSP